MAYFYRMKTLIPLLTIFFFYGFSFPLSGQSLIDRQKAIDLYEQAEAVANAENTNHWTYIELAERALPLLESTKQWELYCRTLTGLMNTCFYVHRFTLSRQYAEKLEADLSELPINDDFRLDRVLRLAVYYANQTDYPKAAQVMKWAEQIADRSGANKASIYNNLGYLNKVQGDYQVALDYYQKSIEERKKTRPVNYGHLSNTQRNLGRYYQSLKKYKEAQSYFLASLKSLENGAAPDLIRDYTASSYTDLGLNYQFLGDYQKAAFYLKKVDGIPDLLPAYYARAKLFLGKNYLKTGRIDEAQSILSKVKNDFREIYGLRHTNTAAAYQFLGEAMAEKKDWEQALAYYQMALAASTRDFSDTLNFAANPTASSDVISKIDLLPVLSLKAQALNAQGKRILALKAYQIATEIIYDIRKDIFSYESKLLLSDRSTELFEDAISFCHTAFMKTQDPVFPEQAFVFCEKNKATLLLEAMLEAEAQGASSIPPALRKELQALKTDLAVYEKAIIKADEKDIGKLKEGRLNIQQQIEDLNREIEEKYPKYHRLRYNLSTAGVNQVQEKLLEKNELLIEFFWGQDHLYVFAINQEGLELKKLDQAGGLADKLIDYQQYFTDAGQIVNEPSRFRQLSAQLFQELLAPVLVDKKVDRLLIIPDGPAAYLPFETLIPPLSKSQENGYLLENYSIRMSYSATLLLQGKSKKKDKDHLLLAFAPVFSNGENNLSPLSHSLQEVDNIRGFEKTVFTKDQATVQFFRQFGPEYGVLHLSTHAQLNKAEQNPRIFFIDSALYLNELYAMQLQAKLVVLSACETNLGRLAKGEGMMSLARGFRHAGANSLIASLWEVSDRSTSEIIQSFYSHLSQGKSGAEALRKAKLDFLARADLKEFQKTPYYWASLVHIGEDTHLKKAKRSFLPWLGLLGAVILGFLFFRPQRFRNL